MDLTSVQLAGVGIIVGSALVLAATLRRTRGAVRVERGMIFSYACFMVYGVMGVLKWIGRPDKPHPWLVMLPVLGMYAGMALRWWDWRAAKRSLR